MAKPNNTGLKLGQVLVDEVPAEFEKGLHLGQWMDRDPGLALGRTLRPTEPTDLIVNGEFNDPGFGLWGEDEVPGWYVPTSGASQSIHIGADGSGGFTGIIELTESYPVPGQAFPQAYGEIAQDLEADTGQSYVLRWTTTETFHRYGTPPIEAFWNGQEVTGAIVEQTNTPSPPFIRTTTYEATVVGQPGTDTLTFRAEAQAGSVYWDTNLDHVSLIGV